MTRDSIHFIYSEIFLKAWSVLGLKQKDRKDLENSIVAFHWSDPLDNNGRIFPGNIIRGTGGAYKLRFASGDSHAGQSGSYRIIYFVLNNQNLVMAMIYRKNQHESLTKLEKNRLMKTIKALKSRL